MKFSAYSKVPVSVVALLVAATVPVCAMIDNDGDGMSDLWEDTYGFSIIDNGLLFASQHPDADADGDGWSNLKESIAGTNPLSGQPPLGFMQTAFWKHESYSGVFVFQWEAIAGKQYTLFASPDLTAGSWTEVGDSILGEGTIVEMATEIDVDTIDKLFWRVAAEDIDRDGDGLSDFEEALVGTNPLLVDSDGDGMTDATETGQGIIPTSQNAAAAGLNVRILTF